MSNVSSQGAKHARTITPHLTLRSTAERCVSKGRPQTRCSFPPFETFASLAPQGEVCVVSSWALLAMVSP